MGLHYFPKCLFYYYPKAIFNDFMGRGLPMGADERNDGFTRPYKVLVSGSTVKNYKIISRIGRGGMGEVYLAEDTDLNRMTALKFLLPHICQDE